MAHSSKKHIEPCALHIPEEKHDTGECACRLSYKYHGGYYRTEVEMCKECKKRNGISRTAILYAYEVCKV